MSTSQPPAPEYRPLDFAKDAVRRRAESLRQQGRHLAAALEYQTLVEMDPGDVQAAMRWADAAWRGGQRERAAQAFLAAGAAWAAAGQPRRAVLLARRALEIDPAAPTRARLEPIVRACGARGEVLCEAAARAHVAAGRFDRAQELRQLLVDCDPGSVTKTLRAAEIDLDHGSGERGTAQLAQAAVRMHESGRTGEYVRIAETLIEHGRHDPDTTLELARIYLRRGQVREALAKLELLRRGAPARLEAVELLVRGYAALGDTGAAQHVLRDALQRRGADDRALIRLLEQALAFDSRDPGWREGILAILHAPRPVPRQPPPPPQWALRRCGTGELPLFESETILVDVDAGTLAPAGEPNEPATASDDRSLQ
ncbi:MAG: hypothetical protein U0168_13995 [Nannocystaceae bacterium]